MDNIGTMDTVQGAADLGDEEKALLAGDFGPGGPAHTSRHPMTFPPLPPRPPGLNE